MPAEWAPHDATWLAWPHNVSDWPGRFAPIPWVYAEIVRNVARGETVRLLVEDAEHERKARKVLGRAGVPLDNVGFHRFRTDRVWTRDSGPIFVARGGEKVDRRVPLQRLGEVPGLEERREEPGARGEGARRAAPPGRSPRAPGRPRGRRDRRERAGDDPHDRGVPARSRGPGPEPRLRARGLRGDLRGGARGPEHPLARQGDRGRRHPRARGRPRPVRLAADHRRSAARRTRTTRTTGRSRRTASGSRGRGCRTARGRRWSSSPCRRRSSSTGSGCPASYANFYVCNAAVLVPTFNDPNDRIALGVLAELFRDRPVVGIHALDLVWGLGTLHCLSQQEPRVA